MSSSNNRLRWMEKRRTKYQRKSLVVYIIPVALTIFLAAFSLRAFAYFPAVVLTGSMTGAIDRGSIVIVQKLNQENNITAINIGDVIHYRYKKVEVIHRVIELHYNALGEQVYTTKGDANPVADAYPVETGQIIGVLRARIPYVGYPFVIVRAIFGR